MLRAVSDVMAADERSVDGGGEGGKTESFTDTSRGAPFSLSDVSFCLL